MQALGFNLNPRQTGIEMAEEDSSTSLQFIVPMQWRL